MQIRTSRNAAAAGGENGKGRKEERGRDRDETREGENEQKHIREYGRADELPPGRFHRSRCYPRWMTVVRVGEGGTDRVSGGRGRTDGRAGGAKGGRRVEEDTTDVAHYANVSRYVVQRKQTEPEAPTPYTTACRHPDVVATPLLRRPLHK